MPAPARLEPLSATRYRLELTIRAETRAKLERARDLMGHRVPDRSLETVLDRALDALLAKLEKERLGQTTRPGPKTRARASKAGSIPRAVRREVFARDGEQCAFTDEHGNRCPSRTRLELDHVVPRACGGADDASNLRVACARHNRFFAEQSFGRAHVERRIRHRQRRSPPSAPSAPSPPQLQAEAPPHEPREDTVDLAKRALVKMGFREREARRALLVAHRPDVVPATPTIQELLRDALGVLASRHAASSTVRAASPGGV